MPAVAAKPIVSSAKQEQSEVSRPIGDHLKGYKREGISVMAVGEKDARGLETTYRVGPKTFSVGESDDDSFLAVFADRMQQRQGCNETKCREYALAYMHLQNAISLFQTGKRMGK